MKIRAAIAELIGLGGMAAVSYGSWMIYQPAGFITGGLFLIALATAYALENRPKT